MMKSYGKTVYVIIKKVVLEYWYCVCFTDFQGESFSASSIYIGAREEARDLAFALASACSLTSARS